MTEHSLEELLRQHEIAKSKFESANKALREAGFRVYLKRYEDCGYKGKLVKTAKAPNGYLVHGANFWDNGKLFFLKARKIKSDGTIGAAERHLYPEEITSVEDWQG